MCIAVFGIRSIRCATLRTISSRNGRAASRPGGCGDQCGVLARPQGLSHRPHWLQGRLDRACATISRRRSDRFLAAAGTSLWHLLCREVSADAALDRRYSRFPREPRAAIDEARPGSCFTWRPSRSFGVDAAPADTYATNVMGTVHVLEVMRQCPSIRGAIVVTDVQML